MTGMADVRIARWDVFEGREHPSKRRCLDLQSPFAEEGEEEDDFEEGWDDIGENWMDVSYLKQRYKGDPRFDAKLKERLDRHLDKVHKSLGFDIDGDVGLPKRYRWAYSVDPEDPKFKMDVDNIRTAMETALKDYRERKGIVLEPVEFVKANMVNGYDNKGELYFITFKAKKEHGKIKTYQTMVNYRDCSDIDLYQDDNGFIVELFRQEPSS